MKSKVNALMIITLCGLLTGCGGASKKGYTVTGSPYSKLNGREAKRTYETLTTVGIGSLNYLSTSAAQNASHFANFVDGLLTHNEFGVLELNLAESASHNPDYTEFSFKVREDENLVWITYEGQPYKYNGETQYVKARDFVAGAKAVCTFSTASDTFYLLQDFISGALEYYLYTQVLDGQAQGTKEFVNLNTDAKIANWIQKKIKNEHDNVYTQGEYEEHPITGADIANIANGSRFGVVVDEATNTVTYRLLTSAVYFPTLLTYSCYLPVNEHFFSENRAGFGKAAKDSILYNGPFYLSQLDETNIIYSKNELYAKRADLRGFQAVHVDTVRYNIIKSEIDSSFTRKQFEAGNIDGFSLDPSDTEGWEKYVTGANDEGTIQDPVNGLVNSRLLDTIGSSYGTNINLERTKHSASKKSYSSFTKDADVANTERALRLQDVRAAIMASFDYPTYHSRYADGDATSIFASQKMVHTYVPKNFVYDDNHNEYTESYYAKALSENKGITLEAAQALIETGQFETRQSSQEQVNAAVAKAQQAIADYNNDTTLVGKYGAISYPIYVEYYSMWDANAEEKAYDNMMINSMNKRLNNITDVGEKYANCNIFRVVPTDGVTQNNYNTVSGSDGGHAAFDFSGVLWGWGADYGDPLTYMNTYTKGGDWNSIFDYIGYDYVPNIRRNGAALEDVDLLAEYTKLVEDGKKINDNLTSRYTKFATAECMLIEDLGIYKPQINYGQGWSLSISKSAGYEVPTANYGLSNDRFTGLWMLTSPLTRQERQEIRAEFDEAKEKYTSEHPAYNIYN